MVQCCLYNKLYFKYYTLFQILYYKFKNYTLYFFSVKYFKNTFYRVKLSLKDQKYYTYAFFSYISDACQKFIDQWAYPKFLHSQAALSNSYPYACVPSREALCTIFMMVLGMIRPGRKPATYHMRGRHVIHPDAVSHPKHWIHFATRNIHCIRMA